mmetsp:Transcript_53738/g.114151  ORF Transcript_53738/g.114151 Transcript_53738/m.114151 type:complete len:131 (+) Transcript_53738:1258-1650(+)
MAKEVEVVTFGLNSSEFYSLIPVAASPTCKTDAEVNGCSNTVMQIVDVILHSFDKLELGKKIVPLATINSDGASHFRKGCGKRLNVDLPKGVRDVFISSMGGRQLLFLNLVGGSTGKMMVVDINHLAKHF